MRQSVAPALIFSPSLTDQSYIKGDGGFVGEPTTAEITDDFGDSRPHRTWRDVRIVWLSFRDDRRSVIVSKLAVERRQVRALPQRASVPLAPRSYQVVHALTCCWRDGSLGLPCLNQQVRGTINHQFRKSSGPAPSRQTTLFHLQPIPRRATERRVHVRRIARVFTPLITQRHHRAGQLARVGFGLHKGAPPNFTSRINACKLSASFLKGSKP